MIFWGQNKGRYGQIRAIGWDPFIYALRVWESNKYGLKKKSKKNQGN